MQRISGNIVKLKRTIKKDLLMIDQSQIYEDRQCLMISLRFVEQASDSTVLHLVTHDSNVAKIASRVVEL